MADAESHGGTTGIRWWLQVIGSLLIIVAMPIVGRSQQADIPVPEGPAVETFYQQVDIRRLPRFSIQGLLIRQQIRYRIVSTFDVFARDPTGKQTVRQTIADAVLVEADPLSQAAFQGTLKAMQGQVFLYRIDAYGQLKEMRQIENNVKNVDVKQEKREGTLMTSVIDADGWKELAMLTLFQPPKGRSTRNFVRKTTHDWGALGSWYGKTNYRGMQQGRNRKRFSFQHQLEYIPPDEETRSEFELPFTINNAAFRVYEARGEIFYDTKEKRVQSAREVFQAKGTIMANMLGVDTRIDLDEQQVFEIQITRQRNLRFLEANSAGGTQPEGARK